MNQISTPSTALALVDQGIDPSLAAASEPTLALQARIARDAFTWLDNLVARALNGQSSVSRQALKFGYRFTRACVANPEEAVQLPNWEQAAVREGTNPYYQPLKYVAGDVSKEIACKLTMWAAIYRDAAENSISVDAFLEVLKRNHGVRAWYDSLRKAANDNAPVVATVSFGEPANDNRPEEPEGPEPVAPVAIEQPSTPAAPPEPEPLPCPEPQFGLALLDLAVVEPGVLTTLDQGGYRGLVRLQGITGPAIVRLLNDHGLDARAIQGVAR